MQPDMMESEVEDDASESPETTEIPAALAGAEVKPGDVIRLKVVSVGEGTIGVAAADQEKPSGSDGMASEFDKPTEEEPI